MASSKTPKKKKKMSANIGFLGTSAASVGLVALFTIPAVTKLVLQLRSRDAKPSEIYEDKDGKSTPEAVKAFSAKVPKAFILLLSLVGLGLSIALAVLSTLDPEKDLYLENWLSVAAWVSLRG